MKLTTKQWVAVGVTAAAVVAEVVCVFVSPWAALMGAGGFVWGGIAGYLIKDHIVAADA